MTPEELTIKIEQIEKQLDKLTTALPHSFKEWKDNRGHIEGVMKQIEEAQRKADDEALRAYNAKMACEEHAKYTTATRGQVEVELAAINAIKAKCEDTERAVNAIRTAGDEAGKLIPASRDALSQAQAWVSQNLPQLDASAQTVAAAKKTVDVLVHESSQESAEIKTSYAEVVSNKSQVAVLLTDVIRLKAESESAANKANELKAATEADRVTAGKRLEELQIVASELDKRHKEIIGHREELDKLIKENAELNKKAEQLLPHTASAGLASAFREQKQRFKSPQRWWLVTFIATLTLLFVIAVPDFYSEIFANQVANASLVTWDSILRHFVHRLPLILPLVWLAIYAGRNYSMAVRMEEDYAFKEAVSTAFEGYKREMGAITTSDKDGESPLLSLCGHVLSCIAQRPGRIYEGKHQDVTPFTPMVNAAGELLASKIPSK